MSAVESNDDLLIVFFGDRERGSSCLVGGKGSNLIALTTAGFPVPAGFVITTEAYRKFLSRVEGIERELTGFDYKHPERLRGQCAALRERICQAELSGEVCDLVQAALARISRSHGTDGFAVRSSSSFEDLAGASFAGLHESYLNARGMDLVLRRVRDCFASLWNEQAVLYRRHRGFLQNEAVMAVVVQLQIECDTAGVGFSMHPVSGSTERMVIEANYGMGESVVSGEFEVDHFVLDKGTLQVVERRIGRKERMIVPCAVGVTEETVPANLANQPCLSPEELGEIGSLLRRVEFHYGRPQDVEWGRKGNALYLFQSRPVSTFTPTR